MARRTNYGFEKRQREIRKQKKKEEKAARRSQDEAANSAPENDETVAKDPPESGPRDRS